MGNPVVNHERSSNLTLASKSLNAQGREPRDVEAREINSKRNEGNETWRYEPNFVEVGLVKDQKIFILLIQTLDGVSSSLGEVPDIAVVELLNLIPAELIHSADEDPACIDESPFGLDMKTAY